MRDERVDKNPCLKVSLLPERNVRDRIVSPGELERLKEELPQYGLIFLIGYYLPMREGKVFNLREKQVNIFNDDSDEGYLELYEGETKTEEREDCKAQRILSLGDESKERGGGLNRRFTDRINTTMKRFVFKYRSFLRNIRPATMSTAKR